MIRLIAKLIVLAAAAAFFAWLADRPGHVTIRWLNREIEVSLVVAMAGTILLVVAIIFLFGLLRRVFHTPGAVGDYFRLRKLRRGYESLSKGIVAAGAGDAAAAARHAQTASRGLVDEPLVQLLEAQAAQLRGDRAAVKRAFESMLNSPQTAVLGLRGLFAEARQAGDLAKARDYAERALALNPALPWAASAMLAIQCAAHDWTAAATTLEQQRKGGQLEADDANKKRAALLTAQALAIEEKDAPAAFELASKAHKLDRSLVPAALVGARGHIGQGSARKASRVLTDTWLLSPHPDLALLYANVKQGVSPSQRLDRVRDLLAGFAGGDEGRIALARAAIAARDWPAARKALEELAAVRPQARVCALLAEIEEGDGDKGRARAWLARAISAPRDPVWTAGGIPVAAWTPISPATGEIVPCEWKVPYEQLEDHTAAPEISQSEAVVPVSLAPPLMEVRPTVPAPPAPPPAGAGVAPARPSPLQGFRAPDDPGPDPASEDADPLTRHRVAAGG